MVQPSRFQALQTEMEGHLFERHDELEGLLLALLSRQHLLLVGPKGAAKSMMIRMLAGAIDGAKYFERLMTRFTLPDELFGPVSISALKKDRFSRLTRGYLPEANFAFLDEIWKANSSILNSLLALINERLFYKDGPMPSRTIWPSSRTFCGTTQRASRWSAGSSSMLRIRRRSGPAKSRTHSKLL